MDKGFGQTSGFVAGDVAHLVLSPGLKWTQTVSLALGSLVVLLVTKMFYNVYLHPLSRFPGPKLYATSSIPVALAQLQGRFHHFTREVHQQYGDVVRISPNEISFSSGTAWNDIYTKRAGKPPLRRDPQFFNEMVIDARSLSMANDQDHARLRRAMNPAFSAKALAAQEPIIQRNVDLFQKQISRLSKQGIAVDLRQWYNYVTFDLLGDLAFGESFNCLETSTYNEWLAFIVEHFSVATMLQVVHRFRPLNKLLAAMIPASLMEKKKNHEEWALTKVRRRIASGAKERQDFMQPLIEAHRNGEVSIDEVEQQAGVFILAGSETTTVALTSVTQLLLQNPRVKELLFQELRSHFQTEDEITVLSINQLKYLHAVIQESLRLLPPIPNGFGRETTAPTMITGHLIPAGTVINISHWSAYHSEDNFSRPLEFLPERWLGDSQFDGDKKETLQPFSVGPRSCIGKKFAYDNIKLILARMLWRFDLAWEPASQKAYEAEVVSYLTQHQPPLFAKLTPRDGWSVEAEESS